MNIPVGEQAKIRRGPFVLSGDRRVLPKSDTPSLHKPKARIIAS
jgi:hypothetical protein